MKHSLFDDADDESDAAGDDDVEDRFALKPHFEGKKGKKVSVNHVLTLRYLLHRPVYEK